MENKNEPPSQDSGCLPNHTSTYGKQFDMDYLFHFWQRRIGTMPLGGRVLVIAHKRPH